MKAYLYISLLVILAFSCKEKAQEEPNVFYTCSMDPQVMEKHPGRCPICKMELTRTVISTDKNEGIKLSEQQIELANIKTQEIHLADISEQIAFRGILVPDGNKISEISSRIAGRIDRLYFKAIGDKINVGDHIYDIYSEELQSAIKEYIIAKEKANAIKQTDIDFNEVVESAKEKLLLLDLTEEQIERLTKNDVKSYLVPYYGKESGTITEILIKEGDYVSEGSEIYKISDYSTLWVEIEVYHSQDTSLREGQEVKVRIEGYANEVFKGKLTFINPQLELQTKIVLARVVINNPDMKFKPGMRAAIAISTDKKKAITVPSDAVLHEPMGNVVWVLNNKGSFIPKMVKLGIQNGNTVEITGGVVEGEQVVISGTYLLNSEYINRKGSNSMDNMPKM